MTQPVKENVVESLASEVLAAVSLSYRNSGGAYIDPCTKPKVIEILRSALNSSPSFNTGVEEAAKVAESYFGKSVPHVIHVPAQDDITSMGRPFTEPAYDYKTTRPANARDIAAAIRALSDPSPSHGDNKS